MVYRYTHLRVYKPDGDILEFVVGGSSHEGLVKSIYMTLEGSQQAAVVEYSNGVLAHFVGFPYSYRQSCTEN